MRRNEQFQCKSWGPRFAEVSILGAIAMALVCTFAPVPAQIGVLGTLVSGVAGLLVSFLERDRRREASFNQRLEQLQVPVSLSPDRELFEHYRAFSDALTRLAHQSDPVLRQFALLKLTQLREQWESLSSGRIVFFATEAWRTVYDRLLESRDIRRYLSVAWVKTADYWQDAPGQQSMAANYAAQDRLVHVERIVLLRDELWPQHEPLPLPGIREWIEEQHNHGIGITLVRESEVASEPDLLVDMGIYGERAVGIQELDDRGRTVRFVLDFDPRSVQLAHDRWARLGVYAISYKRLLGEP